MARKSVAQHMRRKPFLIDARAGCKLFEIAGEFLPREMAGLAMRRKKPFAACQKARLRRLRGVQIAVERLARLWVQRHDALAPAFALDGQHEPVALERAQRQAGKLRDAQARAVQQLKEACEPQSPEPGGARRPGGGLMGRVQE